MSIHWGGRGPGHATRLPVGEIFSPSSLFAAGQQGLWYDPYDITTLYQDASGTTPVTAAGQRVGLLLDKSQGLVLGPNLWVTGQNVTAISDAGGTVGAYNPVTAEFSNTATGIAGYPRFRFSVGMDINKFYAIEVIFSGNISKIYDVRTQNNIAGIEVSPGVWRIIYNPQQYSSGAHNLSVFTYGDTIFSGVFIDSVSFREIPGNHAAQATTAYQPFYQVAPQRLTIDKVDDRLVVTVPTGGFNGTMILSTPEGTAGYGVNIPAGAFDIGGVAGLFFPGTAITGQLIRNGALTDSQIGQTINYMRARGGGLNYGAVTNFTNFWRSQTRITSFPLIDTSSGTNFNSTWRDCLSLTSFPLLDTSSGTNFQLAFRGCSGLTSFPLLDTSSGTNFNSAWASCIGLTSFPLLDTSSGTNFNSAWALCSGLTSFPLLDVSSGTIFNQAWDGCNGLTSFPTLNMSNATSLALTWRSCSGLTSFPLINFPNATDFSGTWFSCTGLTSFPLLDTSSGTIFANAWRGCTGLTSFPLLDTSSGTSFSATWRSCFGLTSFPLLDVSSGTNFFEAWQSCTSLATFPANMFDTVTATNFTNAFLNTNLSQTSIDNILVSIETAGTSNGTFNQSGGSAPSATGETAIDALRARGWTVTVTGGY